MISLKHRYLFLFLLALAFSAVIADPAPPAAVPPPVITVTADNPSGIYHKGDKITWKVSVTGEGAAAIQKASYTIKQGGAAVIAHGDLDFTQGAPTIEITPSEAGTLLVDVTAPGANAKPITGAGGAAVDFQEIKAALPVPADFDSFWKSKIDELSAVPENPVLEKGDSGVPNVDYWKITLDNIKGTHIQGQLARPSQGGKFPAILIVQWAGVYPLQKGFITSYASKGWLVLNIMAHDLPIDQPKDFYDNLSKTSLKNYTGIGNEDRETSYFLRMFMGDYRAAEYLSERPDWNGRTLVVSGTSQGGLQSFVTAGLDPKITAMMVLVPAGCDPSGAKAGRQPGWPYWVGSAAGKDMNKVMATSEYYDAVNFATRVKCPALIGVGLLDVTAPPSGVFAAYNQLQGPKEIVVLPQSDHHGSNNSQAPYRVRESAWVDAMGKDQPPSVATAQ